MPLFCLLIVFALGNTILQSVCLAAFVTGAFCGPRAALFK